MRLPLICGQCEKGTRLLYLHELRDAGVYEFICKNGHSSVTVLQEERFEVLFQLAANAILDGYYREAIASFTSSFETFCEFYLKVMGHKQDVEPSSFEKGLRIIVDRSERILGAYTMVYVLEHKMPPPTMPDDMVKLRNKVVHRGRIPNREEAEKYGQAVFNIIKPVLAHLKLEENEHLQSVISVRLNQVYAGLAKPPMTFTNPGIISIVRTDPKEQGFMDGLSELEKNRKTRGW